MNHQLNCNTLLPLLLMKAIVLLLSVGNCESVNLTAITWRHEVNSHNALQEALSSDAQIITADVVMGIYSKKSLKPDNVDRTVAEAEPKKDGINKETVQKQLVLRQMDDSSNFSFDDFLKETIAWHNKNEDETKTKTIKFNFHSIEATQSTVDILTRKSKEIKFPIWLGADILQGPGSLAEVPPLDSKEFIDEVKKMDNAVISIGWTTNRDKSSEVYTNAHTNAMADVVKDNKLDKISQFAINFPIRAALAVKSRNVLKQLYDHVKGKNPVTYTVWSKNEDKVNATELEQFIASYGVENVYIDLPDDLRKKLNLANGASSVVQFGFLNLFMLIIAYSFQNGI